MQVKQKCRAGGLLRRKIAHARRRRGLAWGRRTAPAEPLPEVSRPALPGFLTGKRPARDGSNLLRFRRCRALRLRPFRSCPRRIPRSTAIEAELTAYRRHASTRARISAAWCRARSSRPRSRSAPSAPSPTAPASRGLTGNFLRLVAQEPAALRAARHHQGVPRDGGAASRRGDRRGHLGASA